MDKPVVALFDFDGTLTLSDTLPLFMRHATGRWGMMISMLSVLPAMLILACNGWRSVGGIDAGTTKERLLRRAFKGKRYDEVDNLGRTFATTIDEVVAPEVVKCMQQHLEKGHHVVIVSASIDVWIEPWAALYGVQKVIATRMQVQDNYYTGRFDGGNCNGKAKVERIAQLYNRDEYHIVAYGNSTGDYPMFHYAHEAYLCNKGVMTQYK